MWKSKDTIFLLLFSVGIWTGSHAQQKNPAIKLVDRGFDLADRVIDGLTVGSWTILPVVYYSPETSLGFGARAVSLFQLDSAAYSRPSSVPLTVLYTLNNQLTLTAQPDFWWDQNRWHLKSRFSYEYFPFSFYGTGSETRERDEVPYTGRIIQGWGELERAILPAVYLGAKLDVRQESVDDWLTSQVISGSEGYLIYGGGLSVRYDNREVLFSPRRGFFNQFSWGYYSGDFAFSRYLLDLRYYFPTGQKSNMAMQIKYEQTQGQVPFQLLPALGGADYLRGIFEGRFRDPVALGAQVAYRRNLYRALGLEIFGGLGSVSENFSNLSQATWHASGGFGFRYRLNESGLNLRLDLAFGTQPAMYLAFDEAF